MVGAALLTACRNAGGEVDLARALPEMLRRGRSVPGGTCGFWGACGAGISTGMYLSILTEATPLSWKSWGLANQMTARALDRIGRVGGPRCCKRDCYLAIAEAVCFTREKLGISMELRKDLRCVHSRCNSQCIRDHCPFYTSSGAD